MMCANAYGMLQVSPLVREFADQKSFLERDFFGYLWHFVELRAETARAERFDGRVEACSVLERPT